MEKAAVNIVIDSNWFTKMLHKDLQRIVQKKAVNLARNLTKGRYDISSTDLPKYVIEILTSTKLLFSKTEAELVHQESDKCFRLVGNRYCYKHIMTLIGGTQLQYI